MSPLQCSRFFVIGVLGLSVSFSTSVLQAASSGSTQNPKLKEFPEIARIPEEIESTGGHSLAFAQGGMAALNGVEAVRMNPGLIAIDRHYVLSAGYHWPTYGRNFYQAGVVDAKTSSIAAGILYTGFMENYPDQWDEDSPQSFDSPTSKRLTLAGAKVISKVSFGIQGTMISAQQQDGKLYKSKSGITFGLGLAGLLTPQIRFGISGENFGNRKFEVVAPRTSRAGVAFMFGKTGDFTAHLDVKHRERIPGFETNLDQKLYGLATSIEPTFTPSPNEPEVLVIGSFSARVYDLLRVIGGFGDAIGTDDDRTLASAGLALVHNQFSLSYNVSRPDLRESNSHSNVNASMSLAM